MARQTKIVGLIVVLMLFGGGLFALVRQPSAPAMTVTIAESMLKDASDRLKNGDAAGLAEYLREGASVLGFAQDEWRAIFTKACAEHASSPLELEWSNIGVSSVGNAASIFADVKAVQHLPDADVTHFATHTQIQLQKASVPGFLGMLHGSAWRVTGGSCNPPLPKVEVPSSDAL